MPLYILPEFETEHLAVLLWTQPTSTEEVLAYLVLGYLIIPTLLTQYIGDFYPL